MYNLTDMTSKEVALELSNPTPPWLHVKQIATRSTLQDCATHQHIVVRHNIRQRAVPICFIGQDDLIFIVEGDVSLALLVKHIRSFSCISRLNGHILEDLHAKEAVSL